MRSLLVVIAILKFGFSASKATERSGKIHVVKNITNKTNRLASHARNEK